MLYGVLSYETSPQNGCTFILVSAYRLSACRARHICRPCTSAARDDVGCGTFHLSIRALVYPVDDWNARQIDVEFNSSH